MMPQIFPMSSTPIRVMVVENHQLILWALTKLINSHRPYMEVVSVAGTQADAMVQIASVEPDIVLMKYELAVTTPHAGLPEVLTAGRHMLLFAEEVQADTLARALRCGAHGLLSRRSSADEIVKAIEKTHQGELWFGREATGIALNVMRAGNESPRDHAYQHRLEALTARERKVLRVIIANDVRTNKDLAKQLFISESTLRNHLSSIYQKLGVNNRLDLFVYAQRHFPVELSETA